MKVEGYQYAQRVSLPLEAKIRRSKNLIREWYDHWNGQVYVSISGGKDSSALLHLVRSVCPDVPAVFIDTGLEYPENKELVALTPNVEIVRTKYSFAQVIRKYGYPLISKEQSRYLYEYRNTKSEKLRKLRLEGRGDGSRFCISAKWRFLLEAPFGVSHMCCDYLKKYPVAGYEKVSGRKPFLGMMAADSNLRRTTYMKKGCNAFETKRPTSWPLAVWTTDDVWEYIRRYDVPYSALYDKGYTRSGCMFCLFGVHSEPEPNRFQLMKQTHPQMYTYCIEKLGIGEVLDYIKVPY